MKVLIATLGTGDYKAANYHLNGRYAKQTRLGFKALAELLNIPKERFYVFGTEKREGTGQLRGSDWSILEQEFETPFSKNQMIAVPYGLDKGEHYEFFEKVLNTIDDTEEIIFDISHGFRSTPVVFLMSLFFKFSIGEPQAQKLRVFYGAYEAGEETSEVKTGSNGKPYNVRNVALVEMEIIPELLAWVKATERFTKFGIASDLMELAANNQSIRFAKHKLAELDKSIAYNSLEAISTTAKSLNNAIRQQSDSISKAHPFYYLSDKVNDILETFDKELVSDQQLSAARFFIKTQRFGQAAIAVKEYLVSLLTEAQGDLTPKDVQKRKSRISAENLIGLLTPDNIHVDDTKTKFRHEQLKQMISAWDKSFYDDLYSTLSSLTKIRNTFAHAKKIEIGAIKKYHDDLLRIMENAPHWARVKNAPVSMWFDLINPWYQKNES